ERVDVTRPEVRLAPVRLQATLEERDVLRASRGVPEPRELLELVVRERAEADQVLAERAHPDARIPLAEERRRRGDEVEEEVGEAEAVALELVGQERA